jgi:hypothetical protein
VSDFLTAGELFHLQILTFRSCQEIQSACRVCLRLSQDPTIGVSFLYQDLQSCDVKAGEVDDPLNSTKTKLNTKLVLLCARRRHDHFEND